MIKLFIFGIDGRMGRVVCRRASELEGFEVVGGFDKMHDMDFKVFTSVDKIDVGYDVIIDFSNPTSLAQLEKLSDKNKAPIVLATTGYTPQELARIKVLSKKVPVFLSGNMSWGIRVMQKIVELASKNLFDNFDVEIIEKHHNQKVDAPSGTAKMLAEAVAAGIGKKPDFIYGRKGTAAKRQSGEVCLHSVRGGTVVGEHEVSFYGNDESITITHTALSRTIFADGALRAAKFLLGRPAGLYCMKDM